MLHYLFFTNKTCEKQLCRGEIFSKYAGHGASKSQLPGFYISGTMVTNDLIKTFSDLQDKDFDCYKIYEFC